MLIRALRASNIAYITYSQTLAFLRCMRIPQWTKNILVLAALLFSSGKISAMQIYSSLFAFILFCLLSSCAYLLNDFIDCESDRLNPEKCSRPLASGELNPYVAISGCFALLSITITYGFILTYPLGIVLIVYFANNIFYSLMLKHVVIADIMSISFGFVLRAVGGGLAIKVPMTPWFLLCTLLLALFLAIGKRRYELNLLQDEGLEHRRVLRRYSRELLDQFSSIVTTATIMCYALYTFTSGKPVELMYTIPLVIYGIFRYLYLIHIENKGGNPGNILLGDKHILATVAIYSVLVVAILDRF